MLLTIFLAIVFCAAITLMLLSAVALIQKKELFSSAPREAREVILPREKELFVPLITFCGQKKRNFTQLAEKLFKNLYLPSFF